ncbi:MAG TPA: PAS domain S-box protein [Terriglobales bacterium]|nr:PAS domain S-box protein [Terriglobales bacterium]
MSRPHETAPQRTTELRLQRDRLISVVENLNVFVGMSDLQLKPFYVNRPGLQMIGLDDLDQAKKVSVLDCFFPEDREFIEKQFLPEVLRQGRSEVEVRFRHFKTGQALWMIYNVFAMKGPKREPLGFATISQNITEQKSVQEQLREKSFRLEKLSHELQTLMDVSPLGVIAFDLDRTVRTWNRAAEGILGWKANEIIGRQLPVPESAKAEWVELAKGLRLGKSFTSIESRRLHKDGSEFRAQISGAPIHNPQGEITRFIGMIADASEMVRAREALQLAEKLAVTGRLAATIAHEINNPLAAVMNLIYLARLNSTEDSVHKMLLSAENELRRIAHITRRTLGFYRESAGPAFCKPVDLVESVLELYEKHLEARRIKVQREYRTNQGLIVVEGEIHQVIANLISNASDALAEGGSLRVRVSRAPLKAGLRVTVADDGKGISKHGLSRVFEPFFSTKPETGVGLGMWVSREIIRYHGGSIRLRSLDHVARHGTAVVIFLPFENPKGSSIPQSRVAA